MAAAGKSVLFVCLGNICRSPIAEAVFAHMVKEKGVSDGWKIDSAATADYHTGKQPDKRARACMAKHSVEMNHRARQVYDDDFFTFQYIFGMDENNIQDLKRAAPRGAPAKILLLGDYDPEGESIIRDPYYDSGSEGFEEVYQQCLRCCGKFLESEM